MHVFHLSSFQWLIKVKKKKYFATSVEIKLWKLYDYDFKDLSSTIYIIDFSWSTKLILILWTKMF